MKRLIRMSIYYIVAFPIYNIALYLTELALINFFGVEIKHLLFNNFIIDLIQYTGLFIISYLGLYTYDTIEVKKLNEELKEMKETMKANGRKGISDFAANNSYNSSSDARSI